MRILTEENVLARSAASGGQARRRLDGATPDELPGVTTKVRPMPDPHTLAETEAAMSTRVSELGLDFGAAQAVSSIYRAANAVRAHLTTRVLRPYQLTWSGFVVLWVVWIWDGMETRHVAESAAISKATLTGVAKTLERRGWLTRESPAADRRLVQLRLTPAGIALMEQVYPEFNAVEAEVVSRLSPHSRAGLARDLRTIVRTLEEGQPTA